MALRLDQTHETPKKQRASKQSSNCRITFINSLNHHSHSSSRTARRSCCQMRKRLSLQNPQRDKYFKVLAEVWIDGESLGEKLKSEGLARSMMGRVRGLSVE